MKTFFITSIFIFCSFLTFGQTGTISGTVTDGETGEPLPFCNVFISNTTVATTTDFDGNYLLENVPEGEFEVGFSFIGYQAQQKAASIRPGSKLTFSISLMPLVQDLTDVEIKASRDRAWERELRKFKSYFLGNDEMAAQCEILNPWVIDFPDDNKNNDFKAIAYQPIEIENKALGYLLTFDLKAFQFTPSYYIISGATRFSDLDAPDEKTKSEWESRRLDTYLKSPANMFRAMIINQHNQEGFFLYGDKVGGSESRNLRSDVFANELGKSVVPYQPENLVQAGRRPGEYRILMKGRIEIHYEKGYSTVNTYKDAPYPISWLEVNGNYVQVNSNGMILNQKDVIFSGDMDKSKISKLLPLDYQPNLTGRNNVQLAKDAYSMQERVYLHTDRSFYYSGDQVLFKAYFNYARPEMKRVLSNILYVELISSERDMILQKKFKIENGQAIGDITLPDTLNHKNYYLRAYTQWNRNYGPDAFYVQPLPVVSPFDRISGEVEKSEPTEIQVKFSPSKISLGKREKISVELAVQDQNGTPLASNLSIAVRDGYFAPDLTSKTSIQEVLGIQEIPPHITTEKFTYDLERSWNVTGRFYNEKGKPSASPFTVYFNNFEGMLEMESDKDGNFTLEEMEFYGPMEFAFIATDRKGKAFGNFELVESLNPPFYVPEHLQLPKISTVSTPIFSGLNDEANMIPLEQVTVEKEKEQGASRAIYGTADYIVTADKLNRNGSIMDLLMSLRAQVPGMSMNTNMEIRIRGGATSASLSMEPLVMINGTIMPSTPGVRAADNIASINPNDIDRIEVVSRTSSMMGDLGRNGVIAVYTKQGFNQSSLLGGTPGLVSMIIDGFGIPTNFMPFDHDNTEEVLELDQRVTLYWNPYVVTDSESGKFTFEFFSNDSEGPKIIEVEGLSIDGKPIRATYLLPFGQ
ncbi:TonB-dependent receptor [Cecembia lonarensis]|uniref:TonB-linked outer membrane protein, SusC/RagA family n=1 Tax=Cecembia lonarensis (strain CCUG 58316 / KCTC 22772 / LW9) TaxID=1225176 RepID=K1L101_CECL9|nr:TonB-dependent receptor [Cecembia lonarensis]EKB50090.1 TonB-linked outer membrane protein, SusC/RagA family [Cecembia lonarensis LW9]